MDFPDFARSHGLTGTFDEDGKLHRCRTEDKPRKRNGAYRWDGTWGWALNYALSDRATIWRAQGHENAPLPQRVIDNVDRERAKRARAATVATDLVASCITGTHDYLVRKGFRESLGLIDPKGDLVPKHVPTRGPYLVIPMRAHDCGRIKSVQWIDCDGVKLFMAGGQANGAVFKMGRGPETWYCEGYATGLSLMAGLKRLYRQAQVVVCFSAANLKTVAMAESGRRYVMADHDLPRKDGQEPAGQARAAETGLPWVMPPTPGHDANDVFVEQGVAALAALMRQAL